MPQKVAISAVSDFREANMVNLLGREGTQSVLIKCTFRGLISG